MPEQSAYQTISVCLIVLLFSTIFNMFIFVFHALDVLLRVGMCLVTIIIISSNNYCGKSVAFHIYNSHQLVG